MFAISLGGDTDTIATMASAMAGAYYGIESIPKLWQNTCEGVDDAQTMADQLYQLIQDGKNKDSEKDKAEKP